MNNDWGDCVGLTYYKKPIRVRYVKEPESCLSFEQWVELNKKPSFLKRLIRRLRGPDEV